MFTTRREFFSQAAGSLALGGMTLSAAEVLAMSEQTTPAQQPDLSWVKRITGKHKAVLDVPEVESGFGVFRATIWQQQYSAALGVPVRDVTSVLVLRHNGLVLGMQQKFWDDYGIGQLKNVKHPLTEKPLTRNPALLSSSRPGDEIPPNFDPMALDKFIERGNIVLGCALAMDFCVRMMAAKDGVAEDVARKKAMSLLLPGVTLQPSGIFAVIRAQEAGCAYVRAS
jgi:hypothetical protein